MSETLQTRWTNVVSVNNFGMGLDVFLKMFFFCCTLSFVSVMQFLGCNSYWMCFSSNI